MPISYGSKPRIKAQLIIEFQVKIYSDRQARPYHLMAHVDEVVQNMIDQRNNRSENLNKNFAGSLESGEKIRSKTAYTVKQLLFLKAYLCTTDADRRQEVLTRLTPMVERSKTSDLKLWSSHVCRDRAPLPTTLFLFINLFKRRL